LKVGLGSDSDSSSSLRVSSLVSTAETETDEKEEEMGRRRRFGGMNEMGKLFRGWRIWKDGVDMDLDLPAWLNIEQVWTHVLRFPQLMFLKLLREKKDRERERERERDRF
jgi:hypothetical protein